MPKVGSKRQTKVGVYLIREQRRHDMQKGIEQGLHFVDAADKAGIPYEVAMGAVATDEEFQGWWKLSQDRPRLCLLYTSPSPRDRTRSRMPSSA